MGSKGLSCQNMEIKATIGNRGFLMYKKYRCSYKHTSNSIRNIFKWFAAFKSFSGIEFVKKLPIGPFSQIRSHISISIYLYLYICIYIYIYRYIYTYRYRYIYTYTYRYRYIYIYIHIYM